MIGNKSIMKQLHELEYINSYKLHNIYVNEIVIMSSIIDQLPPSWKDFK